MSIPPTPAAPSPLRPRAARPRLLAVVDAQLCDACGLCMPLCPTLAIEMRREGLRILEPRCTGCEKCIAPCPVGALAMVEPPRPVVA